MRVQLSSQLYNIHKRKTLDRLTGNYTRRAMLVIQKYQAKQASKIAAALNSGSAYKPQGNTLALDLAKILKKHAKHVIKADVSDGMRESSPKKLKKWHEYQIDMPIELTFVDLDEKKERDMLTKKVEKEVMPKGIDPFKSIISFTKQQQLKYLTDTYKSAAKDWLKGESTVREVKKALTETLGKSQSSIDRIFRTETTKHFNNSRLEYFAETKLVEFIMIFGVTDGRISGICESRHGFVLPFEDAKKKKYLPPFHPNCRSIQMPLDLKLKRDRGYYERGIKMDESKFKPHIKGWGA